jgi:glycosyltransferase involved in cell wall biosynthesis
MKIVLATESYYPNVDGGAVMERNLSHELARRGHSVTILAPARRFEDYDEQDEGTTIARFKAVTFPTLREYKATVFPYKSIRKRLYEIKPDIIHIHNPYMIGRAALKVARELKVPVLGTNHLMPENFFMHVAKLSFLYKFLKDFGWKLIVDFYNKCDFVTSPTQTAVNFLLSHGLKVKNKPLSNGINLKVFKPDNPPEIITKKFNIPDKKVILYTGRISGEKSLPVLVRAFKYIKDKGYDYHLVFAGAGRELKNIKKLVTKLELDDNVTYIGFLGKNEFPSVYTMADVFAIPSTAELQSIVVMEAMASGLPVVAANSGALPELVGENDNGFLFTPGDYKEMGEKLIKVLEDEELYKKFSNRSLEKIKKHDFMNIVTEVENLYKSLIENSK